MKRQQFQIKDISAEGTFEGLLSPYNNVDQGADVVVPGAYTKTLQERGNVVPMLWQHKSDQPIGSLTLEDRADGLYAKGQLLMELPEAKKAYLLVKAGIVKGLSIGYESIKDTITSGVRYLKEIKLYEGSVVTFPMNESALISSIKGTTTSDDLEGAISRVAESGLTIEQKCDAYETILSEYKADKVGRTISAATKTNLGVIHGHMKSANDLLSTLLDSVAVEDDTTDKTEAVAEKKTEPGDHSAAEASISSILALIPKR